MDHIIEHVAHPFDLPCTAQLRRWRLSWETNVDVPVSEKKLNEWGAICEARAIELCGTKHSYTGELLSSRPYQYVSLPSSSCRLIPRTFGYGELALFILGARR